jgi:hypothetical protein
MRGKARDMVSYPLSSFKRETGMLLPRSERKNKKSCNKNAIKNTEMLDKYFSHYYGVLTLLN